jgi:hypothetical protein
VFVAAGSLPSYWLNQSHPSDLASVGAEDGLLSIERLRSRLIAASTKRFCGACEGAPNVPHEPPCDF